ESFFYYRLLQTKPWRSETELSGPYNSYRKHYLSLFPHEAEKLIEESRSYIRQKTSQFENQLTSIIDSHMQSLQQQTALPNADIIKLQLDNFKKLPHVISQSAISHLPEDQYKAITVLSNLMGSRNKQWPYFF